MLAVQGSNSTRHLHCGHAIAINLCCLPFIDGTALPKYFSGKLLGAKDYGALWQLMPKVNRYN